MKKIATRSFWPRSPSRPRSPPRREAGAAGAGEAQELLRAGAAHVHARQRPRRDAGPLRHDAQGHRASRASCTGNADEKADQVWLADLTADMLSEGTQTRTAGQIAEEAARMGGSLDVSVGENRTDIGGDVLTEFGPADDRARRRRRAQPEAARVRARAAQGGPRPAALGRQEPAAAARPGEAPRASSTATRPTDASSRPRRCSRATRSRRSADFYDEQFRRRPRPSLRGRPLRRAGGRGRRAEGLLRLEAPARHPRPPSATATERARRLPAGPAGRSAVHDQHRHTGHRPLAVRTGTGSFLMNVLLGGSFSSRITSNIREQKGYTYSPQGQLSTRYRDAYWVEIADVTTDKTGPAIKEILGEIDRLQAEPPSEKELKAFQNYRAGIFVLQNSSRGGIIGQLEFVDLHGLPADYLNGYVRPRLRHDAAAGPGDGQEVPQGRSGHDRRRGRQEDRRGPAQGVRAAEVARSRVSGFWFLVSGRGGATPVTSPRPTTPHPRRLLRAPRA